jgi:protein required for attachment to host cells
LTANASVARLFERTSLLAPLIELADWMHPEGSMLASELENAPLGHSMGGRAGLAPRLDLKHRERLEFAHELALWLREAVLAHRVHELVLFASDPFMGELLAQLDPGVQKIISLKHSLDLTSLPVHELERKVRVEFGV